MTYKFKLILLALISIVFFVVSDASAGEWLNKKEVTELLSGTTVKGYYMKKNQSQFFEGKVGVEIKFHEDGSAEKYTIRPHHTSGNFLEKGKWFVNKKGALCMIWTTENKKKCGRMKSGSDGTYELIRKKQKFVYEEIITGT